MNIYKRLFCVLLVFVLLFVQFSALHIVHATENNIYEEVEVIDEFEDYEPISTFNINQEDYNGSYVVHQSLYFGSNIGATLTDIPYALIDTMDYQDVKTLGKNKNYNDYMESRFTFKHVNNERLFKKGSNIRLDITNLINYFRIDELSTTYSLYAPAVHTVYIYLQDINGKYYRTTANFSFNLVSDSGSFNTYSLNASLDNIECDAYKIIVSYVYNFNSAYAFNLSNPNSSPNDFTAQVGFGFLNGKIVFNEIEDDGTRGLLGNIIQLVTNIKDGVINLPGKIADSVKGFFDNVVNSIVNLGNFLLDGIKGLFVPSEEDITEMQDKWDELLSDRFGALYQTTELISDYAAAFTNQEKNTITMPSVSIPLADSEFVFGGWEVQVVPDGFTIVFDTLKLIISIVCTIWFVNGLKNRFEKLVGGANNI